MSVVVERGASGPRVALSGDATSIYAAWDVPLLAVGDCLAGRYTVLGVVGQGGCGTIYEAEHIGLGRRVAIKVPHVGVDEHAQLRVRFMRELRVSAVVRHQNLLEVHDADALDDSTPFLVMELLRGENLNVFLEHGPVDCASALSIVTQLLDAVEALEAQHIVHRDIKPANIMLCPQPDGSRLVKLIDYGLAKAVDELDGTLTVAGTIVGTPDYMAPEQIVGAKVDVRADVYACGVVLYELLTGQNPHAGLDYADHLARALGKKSFAQRFARAGCPDAVVRVALRALARDPAERFATPRAMRDALRSAMAPRPLAVRMRDTLYASRVPLALSVALLAVAAVQRIGPFDEKLPLAQARDAVPGVASAETGSAAVDTPSTLTHRAQSAPSSAASEQAANRNHNTALRALALGDYAKVEQALRVTLLHDPGHAGALRTRVVLALAQNDARAAHTALDRYLARHPRATDGDELRARVTALQ